MARHHDRQRIATVGSTDRPRGAGRPEHAGLLGVRPGLPERDRSQRLPHAQLEGRALRIQREVEVPAPAEEPAVTEAPAEEAQATEAGDQA